MGVPWESQRQSGWDCHNEGGHVGSLAPDPAVKTAESFNFGGSFSIADGGYFFSITASFTRLRSTQDGHHSDREPGRGVNPLDNA